MEHEERSLRLLHRMEDFSDLVMGFSLALLGLTLVIPVHAIALVLHPFWLVSYFWTFALIGFLWMRHQQLFSMYFIANPLCIAIALVGYFSAFSVAIICLGALFALGTRSRWDRLCAHDRYTGVAEATRGLVMGSALLIGCIATPFLFLEIRVNSSYTLLASAIAGALVSRLWLHHQKTRIMGTAHAAA
jgi:hypothetical protein